MDWVEVQFADTPISVGKDVAIVAKSFGVWTLSACRIVYVIEHEDTSVKRFGFAYGTLETHVESGEERFVVEWNLGSDQVVYELFLFSCPNSWFTKLGYPVARYFQSCFTEGSTEALKQWINSDTTNKTQTPVNFV
jgi:uncharacterized protein (UPF0548 family)